MRDVLLDRLSLFILRLSIRIDNRTKYWLGHLRALPLRLSMALERFSDRLFDAATLKKRGRR